jgi:hypothetical protein
MASQRQVSLALVEFLRWVDVRDRTYEETMQAWRTSCPRLSHWEDASIGGLVEILRDGARDLVRLTDAGRQLIA